MDFVGVFLNKAAGEPLYQQLYRHLATAIRSGALQQGEKLPGKRSAAAQLGVSVNTVDTAYGMLAAEGYLEAKERSGYRVAKVVTLVPPPVEEAAPMAEPQPAKYRYNLSSGGIDPSLFPRKLWNRLFREVLAEGEALFTQGPTEGEETLRRAIASYIGSYRGVVCTPQQIVVGAGLELLTGMLARLFPERQVAVENPGYPKSRRVFQNEGLGVVPVAVDSEGMRPDLLAQSGARITYLTPSHQFPTGAVMPVGRRSELLEWAAQHNLIVEDDYDSEFRFDGRPLPSLQGLDHTGHVVYAGTFSRSLSPGLRVAYLVLPPWLLRRWQKAYGEYACTVSRPEQHTLARFMEEGHFARSINRTRAAYHKKRDTALAALAASLPKGGYTLHGRHTGLYFLLRLGGGETALAAKARKAGLRIHSLAEYLLKDSPHPPGIADALVLGYGGLAGEDIATAVEELCHLVNKNQ